MRSVAIKVPRITHDRAVLHAGLLALAMTEWVSLHGPGLFAEPFHASLAAVGWVAVVTALAESSDFQPHAVETISTAVLALLGSMWGHALAGVGAHYWTLAHPVGSFLTAVFTVTYLAGPVFALSVAGAWLGEWTRLRRTTPEERVLEGDP